MNPVDNSRMMVALDKLKAHVTENMTEPLYSLAAKRKYLAKLKADIGEDDYDIIFIALLDGAIERRRGK